MEIDASCTWGDGPDVLLKINDQFFDLTKEQADILSIKLIMAVCQIEELEKLEEQDEGCFLIQKDSA